LGAGRLGAAVWALAVFAPGDIVASNNQNSSRHSIKKYVALVVGL